MHIDSDLLLAVLPVAAAALKARRVDDDDAERVSFWLAVYQFAPPAVWDYFLAIDDLDTHPAAGNAYEALWQRIEHPRRLAHCQGEVLKWSHWRYEHHLARERQRLGVTTAVVCDAIVAELASRHLLNWTAKETNENWPHPERFLDQWRLSVRTENLDPDVLERAGLHAAELQLLECEDD